MTPFETAGVSIAAPVAAAAGAALALTGRRGRLLAPLSLCGLVLLSFAADLRVALAAAEIAALPALFLAFSGPAARDRRLAALLPWAASGALVAAFVMTVQLSAPFIPGLAASAVLGLAIAGLMFRMGLAPFCSFAAGTYSNARPESAGFASIALMAVGWLVAHKLLSSPLMPPADPNAARLLLAAAAPVTVAWCSLTALHLRNVRRMAAWIASAQAGFLALALATEKGDDYTRFLGEAAGFGLLLAHGFATAGIFAVLSAFPRRQDEPDTLEDYAGMARRRPLLSAAFTVLLLSEAGLPPFAIFASRVQILAVTGVYPTAALGAAAFATQIAALPLVYCALRVIAYVYFRKPVSPRTEPEVPRAAYAIAVACAAASIILGVFPHLAGLLILP